MESRFNEFELNSFSRDTSIAQGIEFLQNPVKGCQYLLDNIDCTETCNYCNLCNAPDANQLICKSTSQLCKNQFWQNPQQCINVCENGQRRCKKFVDSNGDFAVVNNLSSLMSAMNNFPTSLINLRKPVKK